MKRLRTSPFFVQEEETTIYVPQFNGNIFIILSIARKVSFSSKSYVLPWYAKAD